MTEMYCTRCGVWRDVRRDAFLWLFVRRAQLGVHILEVLFQRVLLVKLNHLLRQVGGKGGATDKRKKHFIECEMWFCWRKFGDSLIHNIGSSLACFF